MRAFKTKDMTAAELVKGDAGYSGDGLSVFTHRAARSKQPRKSAEARPQTVRTLIEIQERRLRELYAEHRAGISDPVRLARARREIDIKQVFIAKLWKELGAEINKGRA
jgi:hypothetical protein